MVSPLLSTPLNSCFRYAALLDCLLSLAAVAVENDWVRPCVQEAGQGLLVESGRHPLQEMCTNTFVANHTRMDSAKMMVLTGPNACGKSVYLKQARTNFVAFLLSFNSCNSRSA